MDRRQFFKDFIKYGIQGCIAIYGLANVNKAMGWGAQPAIMGGTVAVVGGGITFTDWNSGDGTAGTTAVVTLTVNAGDLIVVGANDWQGGTQVVSSCASDVDGAFTPAYDNALWGSGPTYDHRSFYKENATGGAHTITVTFSSYLDAMYVEAIAFSGVASSSSVDQTPVMASGSGTSPNSGNMNTVNANDVLVGWIPMEGTISGYGGSWIDPSGNTTAMMIYRIVAATATYAASATQDTGYWAAVIMSFKGA